LSYYLKRLICVCAPLLFFAACTTQPQAQFDSLENLIEEGIIAPFDPELLIPTEFNTTEVFRGDMTLSLDFAVNIEFPNTYHLHFDVETISGNNSTITSMAWEHGLFSGIGVRTGFMVEEGDFIAELSFNIPESVIIARHAHEIEQRQFETSFAQDNQNRLQEIEDLRIEMEVAPDGEWEILALRLERAQLAYSQFLAGAENRRRQLADRLESINAPVETERLYAPVSGMVSYTTQHFGPGFFRDVGVVTTAGAFRGRGIASIIDRDYREFVAEVPLYALRYGEIHSIRRAGGDQTFYAKVITDPLARNVTREGLHPVRLEPLEGEFERFMEEVAEELGEDFHWDTIWTLLSLRIRPVLPVATDAVLINMGAVLEANQREFVMVYEDGVVGTRYVNVGPRGLHGTTNVFQILAGLTPGQRVVLP
jgi:hypothetical protein